MQSFHSAGSLMQHVIVVGGTWTISPSSCCCVKFRQQEQEARCLKTTPVLYEVQGEEGQGTFQGSSRLCSPTLTIDVV